MNFPTPIDMTEYHFVIAPTTQQPSQGSSNGQINQINNTSGGLVIGFLFLIYIYVGLQYTKHRQKQKSARKAQIEILERIWKMTAHRKI
ncbi:MAG TPA: hypothetical protein DCE56_03765 [Cyanobacteria bacterium UBA8553]|nr:hypothetical protein [Cyanobacteria bacterium UBA8553]HAJ63038.1 hypothetical protein [Cyanobacteria bacterium UBA8543]